MQTSRPQCVQGCGRVVPHLHSISVVTLIQIRWFVHFLLPKPTQSAAETHWRCNLDCSSIFGAILDTLYCDVGYCFSTFSPGSVPNISKIQPRCNLWLLINFGFILAPEFAFLRDALRPRVLGLWIGLSRENPICESLHHLWASVFCLLASFCNILGDHVGPMLAFVRHHFCILFLTSIGS